MRRITGIIFFGLLLMQGFGCRASVPAPATLNFCQLRPVFMENFRNFHINPRDISGADWIAHTPWNGDFGDAAFTNPGANGPFTVANGILNITAHKAINGHWQSGIIAAADSTGRGHGVLYGYFEARMKLPPGPGTWPAFWLAQLQPSNSTSPAAEIDVIEYYGQFSNAYHATIHEWYQNPSHNWYRGKIIKVQKNSLVTGWHDYGVLILPDYITFFLDRKPVWQQPTPPELKKPLYPIVDLALGSGWPISNTPNPSILQIQYVHVYKYAPRAQCETPSH